MTFNASSLRRAEDAPVPYRAGLVTLLLITEAGRVTQASGIVDKRALIAAATDEDLLLAAWPGQGRQDIFVITDRQKAADALALQRR